MMNTKSMNSTPTNVNKCEYVENSKLKNSKQRTLNIDIDENNTNQCISIKSRKEPNKRCNHLAKQNTKYCGRHIKGKKINYKKPPSLENIKKVQSYVKLFNVLNRKKCINDDDFYTCDNKYEIPSEFFYKTGDNYCFDIRTLYNLFSKNKNNGKKISHTNPYTRQPFSVADLQKYKKHLKYILKSKNKYNIFFKEEKENELTPQEIYEDKLLNVFQKIDFLGHTTDTSWFNNLSLIQLKKLYFEAEDLWSYRIQMPYSQRCKIVPGGTAFQHQPYIIRSFSENDKITLRNLILDEMNIFVSYASDINDRKLGAILMMISLVEVSREAGEAMPYYLQNNFAF